MSDIFNEVDEEVRREQLKKLWERYGNLIVAAAVMVVLAVAAWRGYEYWQLRQAAVAGSAYDAATLLADQGKHDEAEAAFSKLAADGTTGYRVLARLRAAGELAQHDPKGAVAAYDAIAADNTGQLLGNLAAIRAALLLADAAPFDEMTRRLEPLTQPNGAFRHTARELLAWSAWRTGDSAAARRWSDAAKSDPEAPNALRARIDVLTTLLPETAKS